MRQSNSAIINNINQRKCGACSIYMEENKSNFRIRLIKNNKLYFRSICRQCDKEKSLEYARDHKKERKEYGEKYFKVNSEYRKEYKLKNRLKRNEKERIRRKFDIKFKIRKNISRAVNYALKKNFSVKKSSTLKYLPYTMQELKDHLEKQFESWMNWNNHGKLWHIDHIVPQSDLPYFSMDDDNFKKCWSLDNLRPLDAKINMIEGSRRVRHKKS